MDLFFKNNDFLILKRVHQSFCKAWGQRFSVSIFLRKKCFSKIKFDVLSVGILFNRYLGSISYLYHWVDTYSKNLDID